MKFQTLHVKKVVRTTYLLPWVRKEFVTDFCKVMNCKLPTVSHRKKPENLSSIKTGHSHQTLLKPPLSYKAPQSVRALPQKTEGQSAGRRRSMCCSSMHVSLGAWNSEDCSNKAKSWMEFSLTWKSLKPLCSQSNYKKHASDCFKYPLIRRKYASFDLPR